MRVRVVDAGHGEGGAEIDELRLRPFRLQQRLICACRGDDSIAHRDGADEVELTLAKTHAGQDVAVVVDGIRSRRLRSERQRGGKDSGGSEQAGHGLEFSSGIIVVSSRLQPRPATRSA